MPFVKLDTGILNSTLWVERECREIFITALLMAEPYETVEPLAQLQVDSLEPTGWQVPPGWYGFVPAAGPGIVRRAIVKQNVGMAALARLGRPDPESRSKNFEGRRLVRVDGGYIVLNYMAYRDRDYTAADRQRRLRERRLSRRDTTVSHRDITQAEAEAELNLTTISPEAKPNGGISIPLANRTEWMVPPKFLAELESCYPAVDGPATLREIRAWCVANPTRCKTEAGVKRFINTWFRKTQDS